MFWIQTDLTIIYLSVRGIEVKSKHFEITVPGI